MASKTVKTAPAVQPNAGVENWYRQKLQVLVAKMAGDAVAVVKAAWRESPPSIGFANDGKHELAAGVMFRTIDGDILLMRRTDGQGWAFPAGGIEPAESPEGAARREASEETGWAGGHDLVLIDTEQKRGVMFFTFQCELLEPFVPFLNSEHDAHVWVPADYALRALNLHPGVRSTLQAVVFGARVVTDAKNPSIMLGKALKKWGGLWIKRIDAMSADLAKKFADKNFTASQNAIRASFRDAGFTVEFKPTPGSAAAYEAVIAENVGLIKSIPAKFLGDVESQVWQSVMRGGDLESLTKGIEEKYGIAYRRAAFIARDQNNKAKAVIENVRRQELGITGAYWQHSTAGREPRPTHVAMNGKRYELADGMYDSAIAKKTWPGVEPNCRCTSRAIIPGFDDEQDDPEADARAARANAKIQAQWMARRNKDP